MIPPEDRLPAMNGVFVVWDDRDEFLWPVADDLYFRLKVFKTGDMTCCLTIVKPQIDH